MAAGGAEELEKSPASFKSHGWEHFSFPVKCTDDGRKVVDKTVTVCWHCATRKPYDNGNTSSVVTCLRRHHLGASVAVQVPDDINTAADYQLKCIQLTK